MITHLFLSGLSYFQYHGQVILFLVAAILVLSACESGESPVQSNNSQVTHDVDVSKIEQQMLPVILPIPGTVVSKERLNVASRITGFFEKNDLGAYNLNSVTAKRNADKSVTIHLGGCDDGRKNCLPFAGEGFYYIWRMYEPGEAILKGEYAFNLPEEVK